MKIKIPLTVFILALVINAQTEPVVHSFTGIVTTFTDSGLGPHYSFGVEKPITKESISALLYIDFVISLKKEFGGEAEVIGKKVKVEYTTNKEYFAERVSKGKTPEAQPENDELLIIAGKFSFCEIGDMGGYLDIINDEGEVMSFMTPFECPENVSDGDDVVVYYIVSEEINVINVKSIK